MSENFDPPIHDPEAEVPIPAKPAANGLLKPVDPSEFHLGGALPLNPGSLAPSEGPPDMAPHMGTGTTTVSQFQFQYVHGGKTYRATITHNSLSGYDITLDKWLGASWVPSASRLKYGLLAAFIVQQAATEALNAQMKKNESPAKEPAAGGQPKQPVTG